MYHKFSSYKPRRCTKDHKGERYNSLILAPIQTLAHHRTYCSQRPFPNTPHQITPLTRCHPKQYCNLDFNDGLEPTSMSYFLFQFTILCDFSQDFRRCGYFRCNFHRFKPQYLSMLIYFTYSFCFACRTRKAYQLLNL